MSGKVTILSPKQPDPPARVHDGWGKSRKRLDTAGAVKTEMARLYRRCASGEMHPEDLKAAIWSLRQMAEIADKAELEARIADLERKLREALADGF